MARPKRQQAAALDSPEQQHQGRQAKRRRLTEQPATAELPAAELPAASDEESDAGSDAGSELADSDAQAEHPAPSTLSNSQCRAAALARLDSSELAGLEVVTAEQV